MSVVNVDSKLFIQTDCYEEGDYQAQCLKFNALAKGYLQRWSLENGTYAKWRAMLKLPSFKKLTAASLQCQDEYLDSNACIVDLKGVKGGVQRYGGIPMAPTLWLINFMFIYKMNPNMAAKMPGYAALIPGNIAEDMIMAQEAGELGLPYDDYIDEFPGKTSTSSGGRFSAPKHRRLAEDFYPTGDGDDRVVMSSDMVTDDCAELNLGKGDDLVIFNGMSLKNDLSISLGPGRDEVRLLNLDVNPAGSLIVHDFTVKDSLFLDGEVLKGSDVLEGDVDLPDYLLMNPEKINGCS